MKNLILVFAFTLGTLTTFSQEPEEELIELTQEELEDLIGAELEKQQYDPELRSAYKTGDDDSYLRGNLKNIFTDSMAIYNYLQNPNFYSLSVSGDKLYPIVPFVKWIETLNVSKYQSDEYTFEYINYDSSESISIYKNNEVIRTIYVAWDGLNHTNIRYISDTSI